ncbi:BTAD domain-containing putative transcriptional regulator [Amycolatopsis sp. 195334CR]|uniref:AfsR/SARP family transcriptional regulator n=1 Tax=Amycolatopsis sp. 195334CR TaxID=2814588 RepID=UPI001A8E3BAC|nr:BTAD domain-containing putative transcriptional regulator [Amycolatopsis sp. 195334CR]MBN6041126.1 tetratricopeptide repeat protein [Amycolatopsis sp. 195334CR]
MLSELRIFLLGPLRVERFGEPVALSSPKQRALLAVLAVSPGVSVSVDALAHGVWGEELPERARASLHTLVARLRRLLGDGSIRTTADGYLLDVEPGAIDVAEFQRLLAVAESAGDERAALREALALWRGEPSFPELLSGLTEQYLRAVQRRVDLDLAAGEHAGLVAELTALVARHPLTEPLWERLIRALAATGRHAEALAEYANCRKKLAEELGIGPGAALQELYLELLAHDTQDTEPPARAILPRQLPSAVPGFVGRSDELRALDELLRGHTDPSVLTVVVHGTGGVGKTTLAVRWAHQVAEQFPDGQLYIDLRGYGPGEPVAASAVLSAFLCALGVPERAVPVDAAEREALLRSQLAGRRVLVLLDNARDAAQVRPLLPGAGCLALITSRSDLRGLSVRDGARSVALHRMSKLEATELLAANTGIDRVAAEPAAADDLARLCGHLPLALRIIADLVARDPATRLAELADELRARRLELLADPADDAADPRAVFSWSYRELPPGEAQLFRLLSLSPAGQFGVAAAAALAGRPEAETRRSLDRLVSVHLLESRGLGRYQFHDLLHHYAAELTVAEDLATTRSAALRRALGWYCRTAMAASVVLAPGRHLWPDEVPGADLFAGQPQALDWFDHEWPAVVAAVRLAAEAGADDLAWRLAASLHAFFVVRPIWDDWEAAYRAALVSAERLGDPVARGACLVGLGTLHVHLGLEAQALIAYRQALTAFEAAGAKAQQAVALVLVGNCLEFLEHHADAERSYRTSIALSRELGDQAREAHALSNLAITAISLGRHGESVELSTRCLHLRRASGDERGQAHTLDNLGDAWTELGNHAEAVDCYRQAVTLARAYRDRRNEGVHLGNLARAELLNGEVERARHTAGEAWALLANIPDSDVEKVRERLRQSFPEFASCQLGERDQKAPRSTVRSTGGFPVVPADREGEEPVAVPADRTWA